ncbi:MAG: response regulator [Campylobacterota bacterium]|nr:response regulator [Campylobacterota bacterium]
MEEVKDLKDKVRGLKVLFVDDEQQIREGTGLFLNKFFENVTICIDGEEGLEAFKNDPTFDIIISDIQMPKMDGATMVSKIKEIKPEVFVIFITATRGKQDIDENLSNLYITKPISYDDIKLIMQKVSELG